MYYIFFQMAMRRLIVVQNLFEENFFNLFQRIIFEDLCLPHRKDILAFLNFVREAKIM